MKKILLVFLFTVFLVSSAFSNWQYDKQRFTFYYTIDFPDSPEKWMIIDDSKQWNAYFKNQSNNSFIEVTVYDLKAGNTNEDVFMYFINRFKMKGGGYKQVTFCQYNAVRGEYTFTLNNNNYKIDMIVLKDSYYYYIIMGYSYTTNFDANKSILQSIMKSFRIYYDNDVVYSNNDTNEVVEDKKSNNNENTKTQKMFDSQYNENQNQNEIKNNNTNEKQEENDKNKNTGNYFLNVRWDSNSEKFEFLEADLQKAIKELDEIGGYTNGNWNGWTYYKINYSNPDRDFMFWSAFYQDMFNKNNIRINSTYDFFKKFSESKKISSYDLATSVMHCIQIIKYERPFNVAKKGTGANNLDYFTPNEIAKHALGDCDTKSMYMVMVLRRLGFDAVILHSAHYSHAMVGLNLSGASGTYIKHNDKKYYFIESTYPGWKIGDLPPQMGDVSKWRVVPIK